MLTDDEHSRHDQFVAAERKRFADRAAEVDAVLCRQIEAAVLRLRLIDE